LERATAKTSRQTQLVKDFETAENVRLTNETCERESECSMNRQIARAR
jgi:hypothetical protein